MAWYEKATDNFNRADETPRMGTPWAYHVGLAVDGAALVGNKAVPYNNAPGASSLSYRDNPSAYGANQYSQATGTYGNDSTGMAVRGLGGSGTSRSYFFLYSRVGSTAQTYRLSGGTFTNIGTNQSGSITPTSFTLRAEITGNEFSRILPSPLGTSTVTDTTYTSGGAPGVYLYYGSGAQPSLDDWSGGDDQSPASGSMYYYQMQQ